LDGLDAIVHPVVGHDTILFFARQVHELLVAIPCKAGGLPGLEFERIGDIAGREGIILNRVSLPLNPKPFL
jgi:hypothetical protein